MSRKSTNLQGEIGLHLSRGEPREERGESSHCRDVHVDLRYAARGEELAPASRVESYYSKKALEVARPWFSVRTVAMLPNFL